MATCDRPDRLKRALAALEAQDFRGPWEVVVADDAPESASRDILAAWSGRSGPFRRTVVATSGHLGPGPARNTGWRQTTAPLVAFTDDDCEPTPEWVSALVQAARDHPGAALQGPTAPHPTELADLDPFSRTLDVSALGPWFQTSNVAYPRAVLDQLGGFDGRYRRGEDTDLAWRALEVGVEFHWVAEAIVHHAVMRLGALRKLRLAVAWAPAFRLYRRHPALRRALHLRVFWKPAHFTLLLAMLGLAAAPRTPPLALAALPYAYSLRVRISAEGGRPRHVPFYAAQDGLEIVAAIKGSTAAGTFVL